MYLNVTGEGRGGEGKAGGSEFLSHVSPRPPRLAEHGQLPALEGSWLFCCCCCSLYESLGHLIQAKTAKVVQPIETPSVSFTGSFCLKSSHKTGCPAEPQERDSNRQLEGSEGWSQSCMKHEHLWFGHLSVQLVFVNVVNEVICQNKTLLSSQMPRSFM